MGFVRVVMRAGLVLAASIWLPNASGSDLDRIRSEPNLDKRCWLALRSASDAYDEMKAAYDGQGAHTIRLHAARIQDSVRIAYECLIGTGKDSRARVRTFKKAVLEIRLLLRKLDGFQQEIEAQDRSMLGPTTSAVQQTYDALFLALVERRQLGQSSVSSPD